MVRVRVRVRFRFRFRVRVRVRVRVRARVSYLQVHGAVVSLFQAIQSGCLDVHPNRPDFIVACTPT